MLRTLLSVQMTKDHPRLRGDHSGKQQDYGEALGSPPLAQGPLGLGCDQPVGDGITPAYAGTTGTIWPSVPYHTDHPRLRGDHIMNFCKCFRYKGSPPLTRGPPCKVSTDCLVAGITPAYAGTTISMQESNGFSRDHPRLRGDHCLFTSVSLAPLGSPPLTRGPRLVAVTAVSISRITPAYAGTTDWGVRLRRSFTDHPRLRGDHSGPHRGQRGQLGSPPLTRGPLIFYFHVLQYVGITPAYAGTTHNLN